MMGYVLILHPWKSTSRLRHVVYAITEERGFVLTSPSLWWNPVPARGSGETQIDFTPEQLRLCQRKRLDFGRIDLIFLMEAGRRNAHYYGFLGLERPEEPEVLIRSAFPAIQAA